MNNKQLLNSAFVSYEELWRSRRVLSVEAVTPSSISIILYKIRKPNSLIVNTHLELWLFELCAFEYPLGNNTRSLSGESILII